MNIIEANVATPDARVAIKDIEKRMCRVLAEWKGEK